MNRSKRSTGPRLNSGKSNDAGLLFLPFSRGRFPSSAPVPIPGVPQQQIVPEKDTLLHQKLFAYINERCLSGYQDLERYVDSIVNYLIAVIFESRRLYKRYIIPLCSMPPCIREQLTALTCSWLGQELSPVNTKAWVDVRREQFQRQQDFVSIVKLAIFPSFSCSAVDNYTERLGEKHKNELRKIIKNLSAPAPAPVSENNNKSYRRL